MGILWECALKYNYEENDFEDYLSLGILHCIHELCKDYVDLNTIDFATAGNSNPFAYRNFVIAKAINVDSNSKLESNSFVLLGMNSVTYMTNLSSHF